MSKGREVLLNDCQFHSKGIVLLLVIFILNYQNCSQSYTTNISDTAAPVLTSLNSTTLIQNTSGVHAARNRLNFVLNAVDNTKVTEYCLIKKFSRETAPTSPSLSDVCWQSFPVASKAVDLNFDIFFGFIPGEFSLYVFLKDSFGNVSKLSNGGLGTPNLDMFRYTLDPLVPPGLVNVSAANKDLVAISYDPLDLNIAANGIVFVKWKTIAQSTPLAVTPISIFTSTDDKNWTLIKDQLIDGANSSCSVNTVFSGCFAFTSPYSAATTFKVRVQVIDNNGVKTIFSTLVNSQSFHQLAGYTDNGIGGSASSAIFTSSHNSVNADHHLFVVSEGGEIYVRDPQGLLKIEPNTGNLSVMIPQTGTLVDGPLAAAQIKSLIYLFIDYKDRVLFYDFDRVRMYDPATGLVTTLIGGGSSVNDNILATDFAFSSTAYMNLVNLPNGDIYFNDGLQSLTADRYFYKYSSATKKVNRILISGQGVFGDPSFNFNLHPQTTYPLHFTAGVGIEYDLQSSNITKAMLKVNTCYGTGCGHAPSAVSLNPITGVALPVQDVPLPKGIYVAYNHFINSLDGSLYFLVKSSETNESRLQRLDKTTKNWVDLFQTGLGLCPDGTAALNCKTNIEDAFITKRSEVYIYDGGVIRVIATDGTLHTIFGQRRQFGDGLKSINARFNTVNSFGINHVNELVLLDSQEKLIRKFNFTDFIMSRVAGNSEGAAGALDGKSPLTSGIATGYWGAEYRMHVSPDDGSIYLSDGDVNKLAYNGSAWQKILGGGSSQYMTTSGIPAASFSFNPSYPVILSGIALNKLILTLGMWTGTSHQNGMLKSFDMNAGAVNHLAGAVRSTYAGQAFFPDSDIGQPAANANVNGVQFSNIAGTLKFYLPTNSWLTVQGGTGGTKLLSVPEGGNVGLFATLPRGILNFTVVQNAALQNVIYYCGSNDRKLYKFVGGVEVTLPLPINYSCSGFDLHYKADRKSLTFTYLNNNLAGIAEIFDVP